MKKIIAILTIIMVFILPFSVTFNEQKAHANIISKPLTITAKKVAKELAQESAVAMAEHILFEKAINEFINSDIEDGYKAVCLDGPVNKVEDCSPSKVVQVKENLSSTDKTTLKNKVEQVLEKKTNTSSKWTKFLDWFVPIFLISGLVATFESMIDGDSESLIDEIAMEALRDSGFIKPLLNQGNSDIPNYDFTPYISKVSVSTGSVGATNFDLKLILDIKPNANLRLKYSPYDYGSFVDLNISGGSTGSQRELIVFVQGVYTISSNIITSQTKVDNLKFSSNYTYKGPRFSHRVFDTYAEASNYAYQWAMSNIYNELKIRENNVNNFMNKYLQIMNASGESMQVLLPTLPPVEVETDFGGQKALEKIKNPDGTVTTPGIESFKYTYNNTYIYPSPDSTTGWKDKATDIDIAVVEDDVVVDGGEPPIDPEAPPAEDDDINTDKDKDKIKKKSRDWSALLTTRFPFSLPWDFLHLMKFLYAEPMTPHWEIKGSEKVPFNLKLDLKFMEPYAPWFRTFIFLSFVMSVIFLHGRFMGGSK